MKGLGGILAGLALSALGVTATAQPQSWTVQYAPASEGFASDDFAADPSLWSGGADAGTMSRLNADTAYVVTDEAAFGPAIAFDMPLPASSPALAGSDAWRSAWMASSRRDVWREGENYSDRVSLTTRGALRRADGAPLPPTGRDEAAYEAETYDLSYTRGWPVARGYTPSGLEVSLVPHAGFGVGDEGGSAEAGATLKIGSGLNRLAPEGREAFGQRARWYLYAAGSGKAVGYNFARTRDGDFTRSGMSHDTGSFLGDASVGVAYRRGDMQGSFGVVYREIKAEGLRGGDGFDRDVTEGLVAFQLSIKPEW